MRRQYTCRAWSRWAGMAADVVGAVGYRARSPDHAWRPFRSPQTGAEV